MITIAVWNERDQSDISFIKIPERIGKKFLALMLVRLADEWTNVEIIEVP